jgi:hypothetical protein
VNDGTDERCYATEHLMRPDVEVDFTLLAKAIFGSTAMIMASEANPGWFWETFMLR